MAPNADCETARLNVEYETRLSADYVPTHQGHRVLPEQAAPAQAWVEAEDSADRSPGENRRLLPPPPGKHKSRIQAGLTLGVHDNYPQKPTAQNYHKTRFQKRKEKLIEVLKPPYFILTMIIIMVIVYVFSSRAFSLQLEWSPISWRQQPWRIFTYGVVHASAAHLALNALVALAVGWVLEREQGWWRVVVVWGGGVAAGALGAGALQPEVKVVGASAAVYALLTAHLSNVCLRFGHIPLWWFRPLSVVVLGASEGCWALARAPLCAEPEEDASHDHEHVAWAAHVLGAAVGVPLAFLVFTGENSKKKSIIAGRVLSALVLVAGIALAVYHYDYRVRHS